MKKLVTTALTSSLLAIGSGSAIAQTTISGNLDLSFQAVSVDTNTVTGNSYRGYGKEAQINISNKGKLSNGINYAAGFSWEIDGPDTLTAAAALENNYIDFIYGNTTLSFSVDHVNTSDQTLINPVGYGYTGGDGIGNSSSIYPKHLADNDALGVGISHNFGFLSATFNYMPNHEANASNDVANSLVSTNVENNSNSAKSIVLQGDLGVKGLNVLAAKKWEKAEVVASTASGATDRDGTRYSIAYNMGDVTVAADRIKLGGQVPTRSGTAATVGNEELKGTGYGIAYAVNKELSIGAYKATGESSVKSVAPEKEKVKGYTVGYNLGAVTIQAQYRDIDNVAGVANNDGKIGGVKISTKF